MFSNLTTPILNDLLTSWIPLADIGRLDFALCEPVQRKQFLELLQTESFGRRTIADKFKFCSNLSFLSWAIKRKVKLQLYELVVDDALMRDVELQNKVFPLVGPNLKKMQASSKLAIDQVDKLVLDLSLYCINLQECQLTNFNDAPLMALLGRNPKMKSVKLCKCVANKESDILHAIATLCPLIESIEIDCIVSSRSFGRFFDAIPPSLISLRLPSNNFATHSMLNLLQQCPNLLEIRVGYYTHNALSKMSIRHVHPSLRVFRFCSSLNLHEQVPSWVPSLSEIIPNLSTLVIVLPATHSEADADRLDSVANVSLILNKFRHLRQLLLGNSSGESKLSELSPLPIPVTTTMEKPAGKHSTRRKSAILPVHSVPGNMLEELFSNHVSAVSNAFSLPALRSVGCKLWYFTSAIPATIKRVVSKGGLYINDQYLVKLRNLEEIELELDSGITDAGMHHIAHQNPHLRVLRITQSTHHASGSIPPLSAAGLWTILQHCPLLHTIEYKVYKSSTRAITDPLLQCTCLKLFPNLKHFEYWA